MPEYGYAGQILKVDLTGGKTQQSPSAGYTGKYIGGHGLAARLYWEMVPPETRPFDPANCLIAASGPVAGFPGFAGSRWKICGMSPLGEPGSFSYSNLGDRWGSVLKYAGYDALAVQGRAEKPVYIYIHDGKCEIRDAAHLKGLSTFETADILKADLGKGVSVMAIGPAGENLVPFATILAEGGASGSGGLGAVMGSKNLKAVAVAGDRRPIAANPEKVRELIKIIRSGLPKTPGPSMWKIPGLTRRHNCYECGIGCGREVYPAEAGREYKALCQPSMMYLEPTMRYHKERSGGAHLIATRLCDGYGLDSIVVEGIFEFLEACYREGLIDEKQTGLPLSKVGSADFMERLTRMISRKEGFGAVLARGTSGAAGEIGSRAREMLPRFVATRGGEKPDYDPRVMITTALFYATEPRRPIHQLHEIADVVLGWRGMGPGSRPGEMLSAEALRRLAGRIWGGAAAADFSTYEGKALAAKIIQDRVYAKESLVLCDLRWTMGQIARFLGATPDTVTEAQVYTAITGQETDDAELWRAGERIFNLQRAILLRQGWPGRKGDTLLEHFFTQPIKKEEIFLNENGLVPGKDGEIISKVGSVVERDEFEKMKTEYYGHRGWDAATGYPTAAKLGELGLEDVAADLKKRGLAK